MDTIVAAGAVEVMCVVVTATIRVVRTMYAPLLPRRTVLAYQRLLRQGQSSLSAIPGPLNFEGGWTVA